MSTANGGLQTPERQQIATYLRLKSSSCSEPPTLTILNETTVGTNAPKGSVAYKNKTSGRVVHQYSFSKVFNPEISQKELFDECVGYQVKDFILGGNRVLFTFGTTNAGKTFTIQGDRTRPGVIPRAIDALFKSIQGQVAGVGKYKPDGVEGIVQVDSLTREKELTYKTQLLQWNSNQPLKPMEPGSNESPNITGSSESDFISKSYREMQKTLSNDPFDVDNDSDVVYGVWISFTEVYNQAIFDLLDPMLTKNRKRSPLKLAQDAQGNTFIRDLKMIHVSSGDEAFHIMEYGKTNLQVARTNMNMCSSRSHCVFTIRLVRYANSDNPSPAIVSSFTFCDLAGSERAKKTMNIGERLTESNKINGSLHVLGRCLLTIKENQSRSERMPVPWRESKLTRIFQRALTAHEPITMIVAASTEPVLYDETLHVLKSSAIAKQIVLETSIKKVKPIKKSRFSIMATQPLATVCWDAPPQEADTSNSTVANTDDGVQKYNAQNEASDKQAHGSANSLSDDVQLKLAAEIKSNKNLRELLDEAKNDLVMEMKGREEVDLRLDLVQTELFEKDEEIFDLRQQLDASHQMHADLVDERNLLEADYETLAKAHETCQRDLNEILKLKDADNKQLQDEINRLQKDLTDNLQERNALQQQLNDTQLKLKSTQNSSTQLEQALKSVFERSSSKLNSSVSSQIELELSKVKTYNKETIKSFRDALRAETRTLRNKLKKARLEIKTWKKTLREANIQRKKLINSHVDAYSKIQKDLETEKREVFRLREMLYKNNPTDQPSQEKPPRSARKNKQGSTLEPDAERILRRSPRNMK